jgi:2-methylisocitrate lyase-like PEP mutase family enzyme
MSRRSTLVEKGERFRAMHGEAGAFIIPNPWDIGTARILEKMGFRALATTSAGFAFSQGKPDYAIGRKAVLGHIRDIAEATELPVSADLENGFGDAPEIAAETVRAAGEMGAVGGSIEDASGDAGNPIYDPGLAADRIRAAVEAARSLAFPFTLTARCENFLHGKRDLGDTIKRLQSYQQAGADVLYAPGLTSEAEVAAVVSSVDKPLNVLAGLPGSSLTQEVLSRLGVKRTSVGSALSKAALGAVVRAAEEMKQHGTFGFAGAGLSSREVNGF